MHKFGGGGRWAEHGSSPRLCVTILQMKAGETAKTATKTNAASPPALLLSFLGRHSIKTEAAFPPECGTGTLQSFYCPPALHITFLQKVVLCSEGHVSCIWFPLQRFQTKCASASPVCFALSTVSSSLLGMVGFWTQVYGMANSLLFEKTIQKESYPQGNRQTWLNVW